jgi:NADH-quinone oxidoreductase subunit F
MVQLLERLEAGLGTMDDIALLRSVGSRILGKSLCALGDFAVYPVASYIEKWGEEFEAHVELGRCPFDGESTLDGIVAPSDAHAVHVHEVHA